MPDRPNSDPRRKTRALLIGPLIALVFGLSPWAVAQAQSDPEEIDLEALFVAPDESKSGSADSGDTAEEPAPDRPKVVTLEEQDPPAVETTARPRPVIDEIVVTATKVERSLRELPISIDAFSGDDLAERGVTGLEQLVQLSPGVTFQNLAEADSQTLNIRGIGTSFAARFYNRPYGLFYEDVSLMNPTTLGVQPTIAPFDLASVEVLKGPQGTLFGGSGLIGAVRYVPNKPDFEAAYGRLAADYSLLDHSEDRGNSVGAVLNLPLWRDRMALRYTGQHRRNGGYIDDLNGQQADVNRFTTDSWRAQLAMRITPTVAARGSVLRRDVEQPDAASTTFRDRYASDNKFLPEPSWSTTELRTLDLDWAPTDSLGFKLTGSQLDKAMAQNRDGSGATDAEDSGLRGSIPIRATTDQSSVEARMSYSTAPDCSFAVVCDTDLLVGLVQLRADQFVSAAVRLFYPVGPASAGGTLNTKIFAVAREQALFFDLTRRVAGDRFVVNLGGRLFRQTTRGVNPTETQSEAEAPLVGSLPSAPSEDIPNEPVDQQVREFNPKLAFTWNVSEDLSAFVSAVRGFRFGGINVDTQRSDEIPPEFDPDAVWNHELGLRSRWLGGSLVADVTAYYVKWENAQQGLYDTSRAGAVAYIDNFGGSTVRGVEFRFAQALPAGLHLSLSGAWNDARNDAFFSTPTADVPAGARNPGAPPWAGHLELKWRGQMRSWQLHANVGFAYQAPAKNSWELPIQVDQIDSLDASIRLSNPQLLGQPSISLIGTNLEGDINASFISRDRGRAEEVVDEFFFLSSPRKITLRLDLGFG